MTTRPTAPECVTAVAAGPRHIAALAEEWVGTGWTASRITQAALQAARDPQVRSAMPREVRRIELRGERARAARSRCGLADPSLLGPT